MIIFMWPNTTKWVALRIWEKWEKGKSKQKIISFVSMMYFVKIDQLLRYPDLKTAHQTCYDINADCHAFFLEAIAFPLFSG
jgi:hypothetical protein